MLPPGHKHTLPLVVKAIDIDCKQFLFLLTLRGANVAGFYRCCWNENSLGVYYFHLMHGVVGDFLWKMAVTSLTFNWNAIESQPTSSSSEAQLVGVAKRQKPDCQSVELYVVEWCSSQMVSK